MIFGVSWFSYVFHASIFNFLISVSTFYTLYKFKLNINYCFFYSLLVAVLAYPSSGTPYVDHHASILSIISIFCFILALKTNLRIYWFLMPILLLTSFLTKQTPTGHFLFIIVFLSLLYFIFNFDIKKIIYGFLGAATIILFFLVIGLISNISFTDFMDQYILFPLSIGKIRFDHFLFPLEFSRIFIRFKLIHVSTIIFLIISIKNIKNNYRYLKNNEFFISLALIAARGNSIIVPTKKSIFVLCTS